MEQEKFEENIAWHYNEPTSLTERVFEKGLIKPGDNVLDAGCGFGRDSIWLALKGVEVSGVNINEVELNEAKKKADELEVKVNYIHADVTKLPFDGKSFDSVIDSGCTHQLSKEQQLKASQEINRVLKPGGFIIYFGFSKQHPAAKTPNNPTFRDLEDVIELLGKDFEVIGSNQVSWQPRPEENANFSEHVGINAVFKKKKPEA